MDDKDVYFNSGNGILAFFSYPVITNYWFAFLYCFVVVAVCKISYTQCPVTTAALSRFQVRSAALPRVEHFSDFLLSDLIWVSNLVRLVNEYQLISLERHLLKSIFEACQSSGTFINCADVEF